MSVMLTTWIPDSIFTGWLNDLLEQYRGYYHVDHWLLCSIDLSSGRVESRITAHHAM